VAPAPFCSLVFANWTTTTCRTARSSGRASTAGARGTDDELEFVESDNPLVGQRRVGVDAQEREAESDALAGGSTEAEQWLRTAVDEQAVCQSGSAPREARSGRVRVRRGH